MTQRLSPDALGLVAERFRILGEATRLQILQALRGGERSGRELQERLRIGQANLSKHLQVLHAGGFVGRRREGTSVYYNLADPTVFKLCDLVCGRLGQQLDRRRRALG
jgi:DNA-binding transcriptional ArsR family regulator